MTDQYLVPQANFIRLRNEFDQYGSLVIAFDFDNTVYDFHHKGYTYTMVVELLRELKTIGCQCICFTASEDNTFITSYCEEMNIPLDGINTNPSFFQSSSGKIYFNALLDDRAGLIEVYNTLSGIVNYAKYTGRAKQSNITNIDQ